MSRIEKIQLVHGVGISLVRFGVCGGSGGNRIKYTAKEYRKFYKYTNNLTKAYQPRNLSVIDTNGELISEKKGDG